MSDSTDKQQSNRLLQLIVGGGIVLFGVILLVNLFAKFIDVEVLLQWWPVAIVLMGLTLASVDQKQALLGAAMALAGATVLVARLGLLSDDLRRIVEIIALLLIGLAIITPRLMKTK